MNRLMALAVIAATTLATSISVAQDDDDMPMAQQEAASGEASKMEHMADAMTSMAQTCETMMKREMAAYPWKMVAAVSLGVLGSIALLLFVILEIQWIRFFGLRIKKAKREFQ